MAAVLGGFQSATALIDSIKFSYDAYKYVSTFVQNLKRLGHDVAELEQRFREEECRMWTFALARNLLVHTNRPLDPVFISKTFSQQWIEVVGTRFALVREHFDEVEELVCRYIDTFSISGRDSSHMMAWSGSLTEKYSSNSQEVASYRLDRRPTESPSVIMAQKALEIRSLTLQEFKLRLKFKWASKDKKVLEKSIEKLGADNDFLWKLIEPNQMNMMIDAVSSKMSEEDIKLIAARANSNQDQTANDKQGYEQRILEQGLARAAIASLDSETLTEKMERSLDMSLFPRIWNAQLPDKRTRNLTTYTVDGSDREVLIEWKEWDPTLITRDDVIARVSGVVVVLTSLSTSIGNILSSPGFIEDSKGSDRRTQWMGIVYNTASLGYKPRIRTLRDLLTRPKGSTPTSGDIWKPPLGDRFRLAHRLAETLLAVHNCEWLHKGLRPENIVFFTTAKSVSEPYLLGWDASRSSKRDQQTEPIVSWHRDSELYQHPLWFEEPSSEDDDKSRFRVEFDHYQLGCVLLEIGLWCLIGDLKNATAETFSGSDWRDDWKDYLERKTKLLEVDMGKIYAEVVLNLLRGLDAKGISREYWDVVVRQLSECRA